jgi:hypothetical protein
MFGAAKEPKHELNGMNPMVGLKQFSCFSKGWWAGCQEIRQSLGVPHLIATTNRVVHELAQQFSLLVPRLENGDNGLSQGWWWRWRIRLSGSGITPSIATVHHAII